jgi:tRNA A-37 threonylcarbamoyl transferase component Bud32
MDDTSVPLNGDVLNGKYRIERELGRGAMGIVYAARHVVLDTRFAVKMLAPEFAADPRLRERFYKEALTQSNFEHPNVNRTVDYFEQDQRLYLVLGFVDGVPLGSLIAEGKPLPEARVRTIMAGVLEGLDYVHRQGVIHRDVKPSNIIVAENDRAVLIDFGIALRAGGTRLTRFGGRVGTVEYMSPEQITAPDKLDHRTDVYSAGVVLFEMATGKVPFDGASDFEIEQKHVRTPPPPPRGSNRQVSAGLNRVILKALEKDPARRFQGCAEFRAALLDGGSTLPGPPPDWRKLAAGLFVAGGAALVFAAFDGGPQPGPPAPPPPPPTDDGAVIYQLSLAALQSARMYCHAAAERPRKVEGRRLADTVGESQMSDQYAAQIREIDENLDKSQREYGAVLAELRRHAPDHVLELLGTRERAGDGPAETFYIARLRTHLADGDASPAPLAAADCPPPSS